MQAIETRWLGPTNFRGDRVVARCDAKRIIVPWDYSKNPEKNHRAAARRLIAELEWFGSWVSGSIPGSPGDYVHVYVKPHDGHDYQWNVSEEN